MVVETIPTLNRKKYTNDVKDIEELLVVMKTDGVAFNSFHLRAVQRKLERDTTPAAQKLWAKLKTSAEGGNKQ